jgi:tetratricopeptide (TPR) repeat protein
VAVVLANGQPVLSPSQCGSLENAYGPYDYTNPEHRRDYIPVVDNAHVSADVLALRSGVVGSSRTPMPDLDYALRAVPNHHLALDAMARLHRREGSEHLSESTYSVSCWFERARRFSPTDGVVRLIEGVHLSLLGKYDEAEQALMAAVRMMPSSAEAHYNLGLLYVRTKEYSKAVEHAKEAYELGHPLPGLRDQLVRIGKWPSDK